MATGTDGHLATDLGTALAKACPATSVHRGGPGDAVDGVVPALVASPRSTAEVAAVVSLAATFGCTLAARGAGTKLDWGRAPESVGLLVDLSRMDHLLEHQAGDFVVRVEAGTRLDRLARHLAATGQRLPVDEVVPGSSVGGVIATGLSGPSRHADGAVRDVLIGVTVVRSDGVVARSGSKVVKNVAGYDLAKLFTGSFGTLGIVTEATFRLRPIARSRQILAATLAGEEELATALAALRASQIAPAAIEIDRSGAQGAGHGAIEIAVLIEGDEQPLAERAEVCRTLLAPASRARSAPDCTAARSRDTAPAWWGRIPGPVSVKVAIAPALVPDLLADLAACARSRGISLTVRGSAADGVLWAGCSQLGDPAAVGEVLAVARARCAGTGGGAMLLRAPAETKAALDCWGPVRGLDLMRRVKASFDPERLLAPGRFVGGI